MLDVRLPGAVWLHGPTGAGKTVLLRSYLQRTERPSIWLTADERHADPAALFAAITALAEPVAGRRALARLPTRLPTFSPEHRDDPSAFARGYFEKLDASLPPEYAFVIDDVHCIAGTTAPLLGHAIDAFGGRRALGFASQLMPDDALAAHLAGSRLWVVGHKLLAFDPDEARELAEQLGAASPARDTLDTLVTATDGWAAGLMLAMQLGAAAGSSNASADPLAPVRTPLALLIAGQVLGGVAKDDLVKLRLLAELPQVPMELVDIAPDWASACARLQGLAERGLFVERLAADRPRAGSGHGINARASNVARINKGCWRLHDLFRNALREPGAIGEPDPEVGQRLIAHLLEADRLELAWQLAARLGSDALDAVVTLHGSEALRDVHLLSMSVLASPHASAQAPRIALWHARALLGNDNLAALDACERAHAGYAARADEQGRLFAAALALFIFIGTIENVEAMTPWVERFKTAKRSNFDRIAEPEERAVRLAAEVMHDLLFGGRSSTGEETRLFQDRLLQAVNAQILSPNETILAASLLVTSMERSNRTTEVESAIVTVESLDAYRHAAPHIRANWKVENGYHFSRLGTVAAARDAFESCIALAEENSLIQAKIGALLGLVRLDLSSGAIDQARVHLDAIMTIGLDRAGAQRGLIMHRQARYEMAVGNPQRALQMVDTAERLMREQGFPDSSINILEGDRIQMLYAMGRFEESAALAARITENGTVADKLRAECTNGLLEAAVLWDKDRSAATELLNQHLQSAEKFNLIHFIILLPKVAAQIAAHALRANISTDFVTRAIRARNLPAPGDAPPTWPWPVRVELLGTFRLLRDGSPVGFTGKTQQKPLELLKFLACERAMTSDFQSIASALWPDAEPSAARKSLEVTVSRLRKLLGNDAFVVVKEGRVSLDAERASSDAREFVDVCSEAEAVSAKRRDPIAATELGARLLSLFHGLPLENEDTTAWREGVRERYRNAFIRAVRALTIYLEESGEQEISASLIENAISREPLAESLYQILMRIYTKSGQMAEAMRVYRQCRQMLSVLIGMQPSSETERLKKLITP